MSLLLKLAVFQYLKELFLTNYFCQGLFYPIDFLLIKEVICDLLFMSLLFLLIPILLCIIQVYALLVERAYLIDAEKH